MNSAEKGFHDRISSRAYEKWIHRGQLPGTRSADWYEAESEVKQDFINASIQAERLLATERSVTRILVNTAQILQAGPKIVQVICEHLSWQCGALWINDNPGHAFTCVGMWSEAGGGFDASALTNPQQGFAPGIDLPAHVSRSECPIWIPDITSDPDLSPSVSGELYGAFGFPIHDGEELLGVMEFFSRQVLQPDERIFDMMGSVGSQIGQFLSRRRAERSIHDSDRDLTLAREIQQSLLPRTMPEAKGITFSGRSEFAQQTGGDYYDVFRLPNSDLALAIGDASGHGIASALVMASTRASIRALGLTRADPGTILTLTNRCLVEDLPLGKFVTLFLARLNLESRTLVYCNGGHLPGYLFNRHGDVRSVLESTAIPLGVDADMKFPIAPAVTFQPGEILFLLSDGLVDAFAPNGVRFGIDHALNIVREHRHLTADEIVQTLFCAVREHCAGHPLLDDVSAMIVKMEVLPHLATADDT